MRGEGDDQGGRWPIGIWFAMVGVSAGTVASFALIGWAFAKDLYGGGDGAEPLDYEPETVVIGAEESPAPVGVAGGDEEPVGPSEPVVEPQIAASPAEPQAERIAENDAPPEELRVLEPESDESEPPQLVPVDEEDDGCGREEASSLEPVREHDYDYELDDDHERVAEDTPELDLDLRLDEIEVESELHLELQD